MERKYTVSEITELIRGVLEGNFSNLSVEGEISNCRPSSTGHLYFTLKDSGAALSAVMFKNSIRQLAFQPKDGMLVRAYGRISVYPQRGSYQIICEALELAGTGGILLMLEQRKRALAAEGLFDEERKQAIPRFPEKVGIISSPTGAAVRDILNVLGRRAAGLSVVILPAPVQGSEAAPIIAARIEQANRLQLCDVLIVGRGGGSIEDLLPFSEESVVRAVAASRIPIMSAVGHEIDWALSDFAADLRAPTPSAAAELVSENRGETLTQIRARTAELYRLIRGRCETCRLLLKPFSLSEIERLFRAILQPRLVRLDDAKETLLDSVRGRLNDTRSRLKVQTVALETASPLAVLKRGFSVVTNTRTGMVVKSAQDAADGDILSIRPAEGLIAAITKSTAEH
jgi:exodeoxyribonuclease VII large subunit